MADNYVRLEAQDLGIIVGGVSRVATNGVFLYKPMNDRVPRTDMGKEELQMLFPQGTKYVNIPYQAVRQVMVDKTPVWRNRDSFDLKSMGINPFDQVYWGRGNVSVEFRDDVDGIDALVNAILNKDIGLQKTA